MAGSGRGRARTAPIMIHDRPHQETRPNEQSEHASANTSATHPPLNQARQRAARRDRRPPRHERLQALNARTHTQRFAYNLLMTARPNEQRARDELATSSRRARDELATSSRRARDELARARAPAPHIPGTAAPRLRPRRQDGRYRRLRDRKATREHTCIPQQTNRAERERHRASRGRYIGLRCGPRTTEARAREATARRYKT